ncbi:hypothetical protein [Desulfosarcina sp.]|uniref:hypothetical protein n=1 Tax=Desulfosarcina sp. TaxID=2027861 RepID=UPI0035673572
MKNFFSFLKLAAQGGLLVLLPILLFILLLTEIVQMVVGLATPIADLFPAIFDDPKYPVALAVILLFGASLAIGIVMQSNAAARLGNWIQEKTLDKLPIYRFVKTLVAGLVGAEKTGSFKPALFDAGNGQREIVYVVEDIGDGDFTALFPHAPTGFAGQVKIIAKDRITPSDASLGDVSLVMNHMGLGAGRLLKPQD